MYIYQWSVYALEYSIDRLNAWVNHPWLERMQGIKNNNVKLNKMRVDGGDDADVDCS